MKKQTLFIVLVLTVLSIIGVYTWTRQNLQATLTEVSPAKQCAPIDETENIANMSKNWISTTTREYDIANWKTFTDKKLGIMVKFPDDKCTISGAPEISSNIACNDFGGLAYSRIDLDFPQYNSLEIEEIANLFYRAFLKINVDTETGQGVAKLEKIKLDEKDAFQVSAIRTCYILDDNNECKVSSGESNVNIKMIFVNDGEDKFLLTLDDVQLSNLLLQNFRFIPNKN